MSLAEATYDTADANISSRLRCGGCYETRDIDVRPFVADDGKRRVEITCNVIVHAEPEVTVMDDPTTPESSIGAGGDSLVHDLGLYAKLIDIVYDFDGPVEHAVIEHELAERHAEVYAALADDKGHRMLGDQGYTMSTYVASLLGTLGREESLVRGKVKATSPWQSGRASTWSHPATVEGETTTWDELAEERGIDADTWPATEQLVTA